MHALTHARTHTHTHTRQSRVSFFMVSASDNFITVFQMLLLVFLVASSSSDRYVCVSASHVSVTSLGFSLCCFHCSMFQRVIDVPVLCQPVTSLCFSWCCFHCSMFQRVIDVPVLCQPVTSLCFSWCCFHCSMFQPDMICSGVSASDLLFQPEMFLCFSR